MADWASIAQTVGSAAGDILGFFGSMYGADKAGQLGREENATNLEIAEKNMAMQRETNALNEQLMREAWARDDTARQRMVSDLENAGLSKWLATGASPMGSSPISLEAPQNNYKADYSKQVEAFNMRADAMQHIYKNFLDFENTKRQNELLKQQKAIADYETLAKQYEAAMKEHDMNVLATRPNAMSNDPASLKYISEIYKLLQGNYNNELNSLEDKVVSFVGSKKEVAEKKLQETKKKIEDGAYNAMVGVQDFLAPIPQSLPGQKPLSMKEWMDLNEYKTLNQETVKNYDKYKRNWYESQKQRERR